MDKLLEISHPFPLNSHMSPYTIRFSIFQMALREREKKVNWISITEMIFFYLNVQNHLESSKKDFQIFLLMWQTYFAQNCKAAVVPIVISSLR